MGAALTQGILIGGQERGRSKPPGLQGRATHRPIKRAAPLRGRARTADSRAGLVPGAIGIGRWAPPCSRPFWPDQSNTHNEYGP